jgi:hypothetical protein
VNTLTAYGVADLGASGWSGRVYTRDSVGLVSGQALTANLAVSQVRDVDNNLVYELYAGPDRVLRLWSPAGGLQSSEINQSTGIVVPNDGTAIQLEVSAKANDSIVVRANGTDKFTLSGLSGATSKSQRYIRAGIDHYDASGTAQVGVNHTLLGASQLGWLGSRTAVPTPPATFGTVVKDSGCTACTVQVDATSVKAGIPGGADTADTAYAEKDFGGTTGWAGRSYTRTAVGLEKGQALKGNLAVLQVDDTAGKLVYELYAGTDRVLQLWSPAGGLRSTEINLSTGVVVPNDGSSLTVEVSAQKNSSIVVRVNGSDKITVTGLSGATTGNQRYLRAGIDHYDSASATDPVTVYHSSLGVASDNWLGSGTTSGGSTPTQPAPTPPATPTNLAPTPDFEQQSSAWSSNGTGAFSYATDAAHGGKQSLKIVSTGEGLNRWLSLPSAIPATPGAKYTVTVWLKTSSVRDRAGLAVDYWNSSGVYTGDTFESSQLQGTNGWTQLTLTTTAPATAANLRVEFRLSGPGTVWADDVSVVQG